MDEPRGLLVALAVFFVALMIREIGARKRERLEADKADRMEATLAGLQPPDDVHDAAAWDRYWDGQFASPETAGLQLMFAEMFCDIRDLVRVMKSKGMRSVLCVGHGVSREPAVLARAGFSVVALDLSPRTAEWCQRLRLDDETLHRFIGPGQEAAGGELDFVTGDLVDGSVCPGPFDVIIERRTVQLFGADNGKALEALAARLAVPGILFSHCHHGCWKPPEPRTHMNEDWFRDNGWAVWDSGRTAADLEGRVAWLLLSTG